MQKKIYLALICFIVLGLPGCKKFTDIEPKGKNLLNRVSDLENLLNYNFWSTGNASENASLYAGMAFRFDDVNTLVNDIYPYTVNVVNLVGDVNKSLNYALVTYDESVDRKNLAASDIKYEKMYFIISAICNIVITRADVVSGDKVKAAQLKAEAYVLRAYFHYMLVNFYAKAYNPATAATDGGIPYVIDTDISTPNKKNTVAEVYDHILADLDAALGSNALPEVPLNKMRAGKPFAYAVKAKAMMSMHNYTGALQAAEAGLALNSVLEDHRTFLSTPVAGRGQTTTWRPALTAPDNLFYAALSTGYPFFGIPSLEVLNNVYEPGNIIRDSCNIYSAVYGPALSGLAGTKAWFNVGYAANPGGLTTSDLYLVKAEALARTQKIPEAMVVINYIRERRMKPFVAAVANTEAEAMAILMRTARIENLYTPKNFINIKRWNTETAYQQTVTRTINSTTYQLKPDSKLWIFPFPQSATNYNVNLTQNY